MYPSAIHNKFRGETMGLVNCSGQGRAKHVDMQIPWMQEASKSGRSLRLYDEATVKTENRSADEKIRSTWSENCAAARDWRTFGSADNPA